MRYLTLLIFSLSLHAQFDTTRTTFTTAQPGLLVFETSELLPASATQICQGSNVTVTRTSGTALSIAPTASASAPVSYRFGWRTRQQASANTLTISSGSGSGTVELFAYLNNGVLSLGVINGTSNTIACTGATACAVTTNGSTQSSVFRAGTPIWTWAITSGAYNVSGGTQQQTAKDCWVDQIWLSNITGSAATVTITDGRGVPFTLVGMVTVAANSTTEIVIPGGSAFEGGLQMTAGTASAINVKVRGGRVAQ